VIARQRPVVLHVPFTYFPDAVGGTEIYVAGLAAALKQYCFTSIIAAPGDANTAYEHDGITVYRFARSLPQTFANAYGFPDENAAHSFRAVLERVRPDIVHLHAQTAAVSERLADEAHKARAKVIFTYHTPTVSCLRGTLMLMGDGICDGVFDVRRCSICILQNNGLASWLGNVIVAAPRLIGSVLTKYEVSGGPLTALRMPHLVQGYHQRFRTLVGKADRVVAVCEWVAALLRANGVPEQKLFLCRQGLVGCRQRPYIHAVREPCGPLRLGYFGRLDSQKGIDTVVEAIRRALNVDVRLDIYGIQQPGCEAYIAKIVKTGDNRVNFHEPLGSNAVSDAMAECDFVVVPSRGLETGPLVVYEAFGAGTPVLGARLGGIAELVTDDVDGLLLPPGDAEVWSQTLATLAKDRERVARLRAGVRPPRTINDVAREMVMLYSAVLAANA
jgi:glycosyltransferase involved in cell wall biosynthesis